MTDYRLRLNVKATQEQERLARDISRKVKEALDDVYGEREYLARIGATGFIVSPVGERYVTCDGCGEKQHQCGMFGTRRLCAGCASVEQL